MGERLPPRALRRTVRVTGRSRRPSNSSPGRLDVDWETGLKTLTKKKAPEFYAEAASNSGRPLVELSWGDYVWV